MGYAMMSSKVIHVAFTGLGLVLAGILTLVLVRVGDPNSSHWPALDVILRTAAFLCGAAARWWGAVLYMGAALVPVHRRNQRSYAAGTTVPNVIAASRFKSDSTFRRREDER